MANLSLPNLRARVVAIRGSKDKIDAKFAPHREVAYQTAEALATAQDAIDLMLKAVNELRATATDATPVADDLVFELYDGTQI